MSLLFGNMFCVLLWLLRLGHLALGKKIIAQLMLNLKNQIKFYWFRTIAQLMLNLKNQIKFYWFRTINIQGLNCMSMRKVQKFI
jgi:hypothetical protein